jgi:hypothetical protein
MKFITILCAVVFGAFIFGDAKSGPAQKKDDPPVPEALRRKPMEAKAGDDELRKLMIARYNIALLAAQKRFALGDFGRNPEPINLRAKRLFEAELALAVNAKARVVACERHLELAKFMEDSLATVMRNVTDDDLSARVGADYESCRYLRVDAEVRLLEARRQAGGK